MMVAGGCIEEVVFRAAQKLAQTRWWVLYMLIRQTQVGRFLGEDEMMAEQ